MSIKKQHSARPRIGSRNVIKVHIRHLCTTGLFIMNPTPFPIFQFFLKTPAADPRSVFCFIQGNKFLEQDMRVYFVCICGYVI